MVHFGLRIYLLLVLGESQWRAMKITGGIPEKGVLEGGSIPRGSIPLSRAASIGRLSCNSGNFVPFSTVAFGRDPIFQKTSTR